MTTDKKVDEIHSALFSEVNGKNRLDKIDIMYESHIGKKYIFGLLKFLALFAGAGGVIWAIDTITKVLI